MKLKEVKNEQCQPIKMTKL